MKLRLRRLLSLLLAVCIVLSLLTGMLLAVSAAANQGVRHVTCLQLSSAALSYYTGSYSYATLKAKSGASNTSTSYYATQNNSLYTALYDLMSSTHTNTSIEYNSNNNSNTNTLAYYWQETDANNGSSTYLYFYTDILASDPSVNSVVMNREHVWPQSHASYFQLNGGADLHHLRPSISSVNQSKSNRVFANLDDHSNGRPKDSDNPAIWIGAKDNITDNVLEVRDNVKGDVARILLYVYVRWQQPNLYSDVDSSHLPTPDSDDGSDGNSGIRAIESLSTLLDWMQTDPVDTWEMGRNDAIQSIQGNRNVFIDYPELAWYLFGMTPPSTMTTPSGDAANNGVSYEITSVNVNNPSYGTATITNSNTVTVTPAAGYYVQSATSTSGTVSINGNVITVSGLTANATVSVVLAQSVTYTISFSVPAGVTQASITGAENSSFLLPTPTGSPTTNAHNYEFLGWVSNSVSDTTTQPSFLSPGSSYTITGNATLIALYRYTVTDPNGAVAFDPSGQGGTFVLAANVGTTYYALPVSGVTTQGARVDGSSITVINGSVTAANASGFEWTLTSTGNSVFTISNGSNYLAYPSSTSLQLSDTSYKWTVTNIENTDNWKIIPSGDDSRSILFRAGTTYKFGTYAMSNLNGSSTEYNALEILPIGSGPASQTYYTTVLQSSCAHAETTLTGATAATCTTEGYTGDLVCNACQAVVTAGSVIPALGHSYGAFSSNNNGTHTRTCSECGNSETNSCVYTDTQNGDQLTHTCSTCGYSYTDMLATWTITYRTCGVSTTATCIDGSSLTFPSRNSVTIGGTEYAFVGWVASTVEATTTRPATIYEAGTDFTPQADATYYALYSSSTDGTPYDVYRLVTDTSDLSENVNVVIAARSSDYAISQNNSSINRTKVIKDSDTLTINSATVYTLERGSDSGAWRFKTGSYYLAVNDSSITGVNSASIATSWTISSINSNNGGTVMTAKTSSNSSDRYLRYSSSSFSTSSRSANSICLYKKNTVTPKVDSYTTELNLHTHTPVTDAAVAPTCTQTGLTAGSHCSVCNAVLTAQEVVPATGHTPVTDAAVAPTCTQTGLTAGSHCSVCNAVLTAQEVIPATGHTEVTDEAVAPTCTETGLTAGSHCSVCNTVLTAQEVVPATGHTEVTDAAVAPTCTETGLTAGSHCSVCNTVLTAQEVVPATGHTRSYVDNGDGTHDEVCTVCDTVLTDNEAHAYDNGVCSHCGATEPTMQLVSRAPVLNGKIDMTYTVTVPSGYTNPRMVFIFHEAETEVTTYTTENGNLKFKFAGINPQCMGDEITATLYATKNGSEESLSAGVYSVRQYCVNMLARTGDNAISNDLRTLLSDMLAYGAAAQTYMSYKQGSLVTDGVTGMKGRTFPVAGISGKDASFSGTASTDVYWLSAGLTLTDSVAMRFRFYAASTENLSVTLTFNGNTQIIDEFTSVGGGVYEFSFTNIQANEFDIPATVCFNSGNEQVGNSLSYRVNSYVQSKQADAETANLAALVQALYNYGASAADYNGSAD